MGWSDSFIAARRWVGEKHSAVSGQSKQFIMRRQMEVGSNALWPKPRR